MLRSMAIRNQAIIRGSLSRAVRTRIALRLLSIQATKTQNVFRLTTYELNKPKTASLWSTNFVRMYSSLPPHIKVKLPSLSPTMDKGTISKWEKKEGDKVKEGDLLAEVETDKATVGFETSDEGYIAKILVPAGVKDVPIGKLVCIIVQKESDIAAFKDYVDDSAAEPPPKKAADAAPAPPPPPSSPPPPTVSSAPPAPSSTPRTASEQRGTRVYASPMAKKLAETQKLRLEGKGSGIYGSIKSGDLAGMKASGAAAGATGPGGYKDIPVTSIRAVIAKRLLQSKQQTPHYYVTVRINVDRLLQLREKVNKLYAKDKIKVSVNDFIIKATAAACLKVPECNSYWMDTIIRQFDNVDVSVAVSTDRGLITPIVFSAHQKGVFQISKEVKALAAKARANKLKPQEFQGGTVSVSNLGMYGVSEFMAVINPPQSAILAIGATKKSLVLDSKSKAGFKQINVLTVTLSADHRVIDGAVAAQWLQHFSDFMEDPSMMIL